MSEMDAMVDALQRLDRRMDRMRHVRQVGLISTREIIDLRTTFVYPPIPTRNFDWQAVDDATFDADYDYESGRYVTTCHVGSGATEAEAIADLFDRMEER